MSHDIADGFRRGDFRLLPSLAEMVRAGDFGAEIAAQPLASMAAQTQPNDSSVAAFRRVAVESLAWATGLRNELRQQGWSDVGVHEARNALQQLIDDAEREAPSLAGEDAEAVQSLRIALLAAQEALAKVTAENAELQHSNAELGVSLVKIQQAAEAVQVVSAALARVAELPPDKPPPAAVLAVFKATRQMVEGDDQAVSGCNIVESICVRAKVKPYKYTEHRRSTTQIARQDTKNFINCIDAAKEARGEAKLNRTTPEFCAMDMTRIVCAWLPVVDADTAASRAETVKRVVSTTLKDLGFEFRLGAPPGPEAADTRQAWLCALADDGGFRKPLEKSQAA